MIDSLALPPIWNVPYRRNEFFTGRGEILTHLHDSLQANNAATLTQPQGISGLGGIGKTQTALEYAYRYHRDYHAVLWARADSQGVLISDFVRIAHLLNLPEKDEQDQNRIVEAVMHWLKVNSHWLFILDNVEDLAIAAPFVPMAGRGHILLTTRTQAMAGIAQRIEVDKMYPEVGSLFLLRRANFIAAKASLDATNDEDRTQAMEISRAVDGLPLALDQAGAYIKETHCSLFDYLDLYRTRNADLLKVRSTSDYPNSVATTWSLSFEKVTQANRASAELLSLCAFLHPDAIPEEIITDGAPDLGLILQPVATDAIQLDQAIKELRRFSLLQRESDDQTFTIHRLVQAVLKDKMDESMQRQWAERTVRTVNRVFSSVEFVMWQRCQRCLPHAQACAELIEQDGMTFAEATRLLSQTGNYLQIHSHYAQAEPLYQHALAIDTRIFGPEHPEVAFDLNNLAMLYWARGKYAQAEPLYQHALEIRERFLGPTDAKTIASINNLAVLYWSQGKYNKAEPLYQRVLAIREQASGPDHLNTALTLNNLAMLYRAQGKYEQAELLYQRALAIREHQLGFNHPDTATSLNNLAVLYYKQGKYDQAEPLYQRALAIYEQALGPDHPDLAASLNNLAVLYYKQGRYDQAKPLYQRTLTINEKVLGLDHPDLAANLNNLALLYCAQGQYVQAESLYQRALAINEHTLEPGHSNVAASLKNLAVLYYNQGKYDQAELLYQRALAIYEQVLGLEHPDTAIILNDLAVLYSRPGKYERAEPLYQRALAIYKQVLGPQHPRTVSVEKNYTNLLRRMKREDEAAKVEKRL